jgi:hypothetical protein
MEDIEKHFRTYIKADKSRKGTYKIYDNNWDYKRNYWWWLKRINQFNLLGNKIFLNSCTLCFRKKITEIMIIMMQLLTYVV